jgi:hypothetical protein
LGFEIKGSFAIFTEISSIFSTMNLVLACFAECDIAKTPNEAPERSEKSFGVEFYAFCV